MQESRDEVACSVVSPVYDTAKSTIYAEISKCTKTVYQNHSERPNIRYINCLLIRFVTIQFRQNSSPLEMKKRLYGFVLVLYCNFVHSQGCSASSVMLEIFVILKEHNHHLTHLYDPEWAINLLSINVGTWRFMTDLYTNDGEK